MRYPSRFVVWSALLTCCVLFWVWVVGMLIDWLEVEEQPASKLMGAGGQIRAQVIYPQKWAGAVLDIKVRQQ
jgi:hypothetical protein